MRTLIAVAMLLALAACKTTPPVPETVYVTVEKLRPIPDWAKTPLPVAERKAETVGEHLRVEDANTGMLRDVANCHRRLLSKLDAGEAVDPKECRKP